MKKISTQFLVLGALALGANGFAGTAPEVIQVPKAQSQVQAPAPVCKRATVADVFTVSDLTNACGEPVKNSGLRGAINRHHRCTTEHLVAKVFAGCTTCENCATLSQVAQIRCQRGGCHVCENEEYITALIQDLASPSNKVRAASRRSLRLCGLRVTHDRACTEGPVPSVVLYQ